MSLSDCKPTKQIRYRERIKAMLAALGVSDKRAGYDYILTIIELTIDDPECLWSLTKCLYPKVAEVYNVRPGAVESAIRRIANKSWSDHRLLLNELAGYDLEKAPTNFEFIEMIAVEVGRIRL